jgi:parallel beta-helix repeat protein
VIGGSLQRPAATNNQIVGNKIGTNGTGTAALGNAGNGIVLLYAGNTVGGTTSRAGNLISGNRGNGIEIDALGGPATGDLIEDNKIGTDTTGTVKLGNQNGIHLFASHNTVAGNLVSGNRAAGIWVDGTASNAVTAANVLVGNQIGTTANGTGGLGNTGAGVLLYSSSNQVGGTTTAAGNRISFNGKSGVVVQQGNGNIIRHNSITANVGGGITLAAHANLNQAAPLLTQVVKNATSTTIAGTLTSTASSSFTLEFFANPSGTGQGAVFLGQATVHTDSHGHASFHVTFSVHLASGAVVTATATDSLGDTSAFSKALA